MRIERQSRGQLSKGDQVEVQQSNGAYYAAKVLVSPSPSAMQKGMVLVEYQSGYEGLKRVKGYVSLNQVRPLPPREVNLCLKPGDSVDAYWENSCRKGFVKDILENSRYVVRFDWNRNGAKNEVESEIQQCSLRLHREWNDGSWVPPLTDQLEKDDKSKKVKVRFVFRKGAADAKFQKNDKVEVTTKQEGLLGSWFSAVIVGYFGNGKYLVGYSSLRTEDGVPFREEAKACHIRPRPPELPCVASFRLHEVVDAWHNNGWWMGEISRVLCESKYAVYFSLPNEELEFDLFNLRIHQKWWMNGKWIKASEEKLGQLVTNSNKSPYKMDVKEKQLHLKFPKGMKVEVKSDEHGFEGSWFSAIIVRSLGNDNYLVEYLTLKTEDQDAFLREEAHASYIMPCQPHSQHAYPYRLLEGVDAWYNDGWWIGEIVKVLAGWRYAVYFTTTNEELEFEHADLRPHQEWINGKWVIADIAENN